MTVGRTHAKSGQVESVFKRLGGYRRAILHRTHWCLAILSQNHTDLAISRHEFCGVRRVTLESDGQRDLFPNNTLSHFRLRLPEQWTLDATWEVALVQLLMPHTFHNVQDHQIQCSVHYPSRKQGVSLAGGLYVTLADVVLALHQAIETESPCQMLAPLWMSNCS